MENTQNPTVKKLLREINQVEIQLEAVKQKVSEVENEEKQEMYKKNFLEVRTHNLKRNIEFYKNYSKKMGDKLALKLSVYSRFSMADDCYDKLLETYREMYLQQKSFEPMEENDELEKRQENIEGLERQVKELQSKIDLNSATINSLLKDLRYDIN